MAVLSLGVSIGQLSEGYHPREVHAAGLRTVVNLNGPHDYGTQDDEHRFRIDEYWPIPGKIARATGEASKR